MTLSEALDLVQWQDARRGKDAGRKRRLFLICGFEPLHLRTFLRAHCAERLPDEAVEIKSGLYGDFEGNLTAAAGSDCDAAAMVVEWSDLDSRLGLRSSGGWHFSIQQDILANCRDRFARLLEKLRAVASAMPLVLVGPTLSVPLLGHTAGWQIGENELELERLLVGFLADAARVARVCVLNPARLDKLSPPASRLNVASELKAGFPYTLEHASVLAGQIVGALFPAAPMKGLITDLDNTFWSGIVGEVGAAGVSWSLAEHSQIHGIYQQLLRHFSEMGVLLGIASKNDLTLVQDALKRNDLFVSGEKFFPVRADWGLKSAHVEAILRSWNIGADSVVFVDDSPMELAEVKAAFPAMTCLEFPAKPSGALALFEQLRDLFGKPVLQREDALRQAGIQAFHESAQATDPADFVRNLQGGITFDLAAKNGGNSRLLELINKTNQFNLNGLRISEAEWVRHLADPSAFVAGVSYEDKFGPLGVIGVVAGKRVGETLEVSTWVMSCRAFSRRIEFHTLECLFETSGAPNISLAFRATERNGPTQEFLTAIGLSADGNAKTVLSRDQFTASGHDLPHRVSIIGQPALRPR